LCEYLSLIFTSKDLKLVPPIYEIRSLKHSYGDKTVLAIEHLTVEPASIVGLIGPNGSGKSSLLRLLGLIERPTRGKILFNGREVAPFSDEARFLITLLPQEPFLMKRSVFKNVSYGLKLRGNGSDRADRVKEALSLVGLVGKDFARRPWDALSGGEAQRVALAARLALKPKVLLLDEPTASVDAASAQLIKEASLRARQELGTTLIIASHDWDWLYEVCDEVRHLFKGRLFGTGKENVIFGPWRRDKGKLWEKRLADGQYIHVSEPPAPDAVAIIEPTSIVSAAGTPPADPDVRLLKGTISRLALEKTSGEIVVTLLIGNLPFTVKSSQQKIQQEDLYPGQRVVLYYQPNGVNWI
jgi:tungstate transport system ATP-binding protein